MNTLEGSMSRKRLIETPLASRRTPKSSMISTFLQRLAILRGTRKTAAHAGDFRYEYYNS